MHISNLRKEKTMTQVKVDVQKISAEKHSRPHKSQFKLWLEHTIAYIENNSQYADKNPRQPAEVCIRIVDKIESAKLNNKFRSKNAATNVLSFPIDTPVGEPYNLLGDIVMCGFVIAQEAKEQGKNIKHHWTHLFIHSVLHLLGFDHQHDDDAQIMEEIEVAILQELKIENPYE